MPKFAPPHPRSAQPGDGEWVAVPQAGEVDGAPVMLRTTVRPHPFRKDKYAAVVAIDGTHAELHFVVGMKEPESKLVSGEKRRGRVPGAHQADLICAFNGGFMARHGNFGAMLDGDVYLPPRDGACTIGLTKDGAVRVAPWEELASAASELRAYRQTPPCLVHRGVLHPLLGSDEKKWGLSAEGKYDIRRSALGIDATGRAVMVAVGEWVTPKEFAEAVAAAGMVTAAELDINWSYTRFNFYGKNADGQLEVQSTLIPKLVHSKKSYVGEPAERDFFYVKRKR